MTEELRRSTRKRRLTERAFVPQTRPKKSIKDDHSDGEASGDDEEYEIEAILACSPYTSAGRDGAKEIFYVVRWKGWGPEYDEWVAESELEYTAAEALEDFRAHRKPFKILGVEVDKSTRYRVRFGIESPDLQPSPLNPTETMTETQLRRAYGDKTVAACMKEYFRKGGEADKAARRAEREAARLATVRRDRVDNITINGTQYKARKQCRVLHFLVEWIEDDEQCERWLSRTDMVHLFPTSAAQVIKAYRDMGMNAKQTEDEDIEVSEYDRERLANIELNKSLLRDLWLEGIKSE